MALPVGLLDNLIVATKWSVTMVANCRQKRTEKAWMPWSYTRLWHYLVVQKQLLLIAVVLFPSDSWALLVYNNLQTNSQPAKQTNKQRI